MVFTLLAPFIGMFIGGILELKWNFMIDSEYYLDKLENKYNRKIDKRVYCKFDGKEKIKSSVILMVIVVVLKYLNFENTSVFCIIMAFSAIDYIYYLKKRENIIKKFPIKE